MPETPRLRRAVRAVFSAAPRTRDLLFAALDAAALPFQVFRFRHPRGPRTATHDTPADIARFNAAAESYFAQAASHEALAAKPFSEPSELSRRLIDLGILIDALRIAPGHVVLEVGAGAAWVSRFLNRFGCRTIALDVSATALRIGARAFRGDNQTDVALHPAFVCYDGHTIPLASASVDAIVLYDVYHHLPNADTILREMYRVLRQDGVVAMSEPGHGHAASSPSRAESGSSGVLENELVLEDIGESALRAGFTAARFIPAADRTPEEIDIARFRAFLGGRGLARYWADLAASLDSHYFVVLTKGDPQATTRRPKRLRAGISVAGEPPLRLRAGHEAEIRVHLRNLGDTRWLAGEGPGWTRLGAHLSRADGAAAPIDYDWMRAALPHDIGPGGEADVVCRLPAIVTAGAYTIELDLVVEGVTWFANRESAALLVGVIVQ